MITAQKASLIFIQGAASLENKACPLVWEPRTVAPLFAQVKKNLLDAQKGLDRNRIPIGIWKRHESTGAFVAGIKLPFGAKST